MRTPEAVFEILRRSLENGETVDIDGLGVLEKASSGEIRFTPQAQPQVFVAYVAEDLTMARRLAEGLRSAGCAPWLDKDKLLPGQNWLRAIERAIEDSDAFVACFSSRSILKRGQFQSELRYALDCARKLPLDQGFFIPVRLEPCAVPRRIADHVQYVDLFPDWERGIRRIARAVARNAPWRSNLVVQPRLIRI